MKKTYGTVLFLFIFFFTTLVVAEDFPLLTDDGEASDGLTEALLYPAEFKNKRFVYISNSDESIYCLDSSLSSSKPFVQVFPQRITWPQIGGVELRVNDIALKLIPEGRKITDNDLDKGFAIKWLFKATGQDFRTLPVFKIQAVGAEVFSTQDAKVLMRFEEPPPQPICTDSPEPGFPSCTLNEISNEIDAVAVNYNATLVALAISGVKPRIELYNIKNDPELLWQSTFSLQSGGVAGVSFSSDSQYVAALLGNGEIHRFNAATGGEHLAILSTGTISKTLSPGSFIAVSSQNGELTIWRLEDGTIEWKISGKKTRGDADKIAVSGDGQIITTLEYTESATIIRYWEIYNSKALGQIDLQGTNYNDIALNNNGTKIFISNQSIGLLTADLTTKNPEMKNYSQETSSCTANINYINSSNEIQCSGEGEIFTISLESKKISTLKTPVKSALWIVSVSLNGKTIIGVSSGKLLIWR
ncbi:MAG: hypothetical protein JXR91_07155 [Deltaproteobacteria bacterium]|nr:hypothetical protein [Deltaproteobacteria bacterium]